MKVVASLIFLLAAPPAVLCCGRLSQVLMMVRTKTLAPMLKVRLDMYERWYCSVVWWLCRDRHKLPFPVVVSHWSAGAASFLHRSRYIRLPGCVCLRESAALLHNSGVGSQPVCCYSSRFREIVGNLRPAIVWSEAHDCFPSLENLRHFVHAPFVGLQAIDYFLDPA